MLDCWFESGSMPYGQQHYPFENKDLFMEGFPADFIAEGLDQTRGWFYTLTVLSVALFDSVAFKNCITTGMILAEDGRKMSKTYQNTIPIFLKKDDLRKKIMKIKTDSKEPGEPKVINESSIFSIYRAFASEDQIKNLANQYQEGIAWGEAKELLFELLENKINPFRKNYEVLIDDRTGLEKILLSGAEKALDVSTPIINKVRQAVGIRGFGD